MAINTRSPYYVDIVSATIDSAKIEIWIYDGDKGTSLQDPDYTLTKSKAGVSTKVSFEIAELIRDYLDVTFSGSYSSQAVWVKTIITAIDSQGGNIYNQTATQLALDSYTYFEDVGSFDIDEEPLFISNRTIFSLANNSFKTPIFTDDSPTVALFRQGVQLSSTTYSASNLTSEQIEYITINPPNTSASNIVDQIKVSDSNGDHFVTVKTIEECKFEPKKVTFINKFGALQDMYFFKKSVEKINVSKESYKANIIDSGNSYSKSNHINREFNVSGNESISLSSGFLNEDYNEVFKQLLLSEKVWITGIKSGVEQTLPINVITSNMTFKTSLNDRLVEYTLDFAYSFNIINNIR